MTDEIDFFKIIDILAKEYGWTIEYIQNLQNTEILKLLKKINSRKIEEYKILCYIMNCAYNGKQPQMGDTETSKMSEEEALKALMGEIKGKVTPIQEK